MHTCIHNYDVAAIVCTTQHKSLKEGNLTNLTNSSKISPSKFYIIIEKFVKILLVKIFTFSIHENFFPVSIMY